MLGNIGVRIIRRFPKNTFRRWSYNGFSTGPFNIKRTKGRWGRRTINDIFPSFLVWSSIIFWLSSDGNRCRTVHHEYLRAKRCIWRRLLDHLGLLRWERFFKGRRSSLSAFEQLTNLGSSRTIFSVVILITNQTGILRLSLWTIINTRFRWFRFLGHQIWPCLFPSLALFFPLSAGLA